MPRNRIEEEARQVIFNVYVYFLNEAQTFKRIEYGYFQKVQERVAQACCVSRRFVQNLLKERELLGRNACTKLPIAISGRMKRKPDVEDLDNKSAVGKAKTAGNETTSCRTPVTHTTPPPLAPLVTQQELPRLTPLVPQSEVPRRKAISVKKMPPSTSFGTKPEMPPLTPLFKSQISSLTPPPLIAKQVPKLSMKPQPLLDSFHRIDFKTVPIEYAPSDFDCDVSIKQEKCEDSDFDCDVSIKQEKCEDSD